MATDNTEDETQKLTSNRPEDSDFKQQRLKAWQPILTPAWVIGTFLSVGVVFIAIGIAVLIASNDVVEQSTGEYQGTANPISITSPGAASAFSQSCPNRAGGTAVDSNGASCVVKVEMKIKEDMDSPVYMYFELSNFYQNHRRYVKSRNDQQLMDNSKTTETDQCSPIDSYNTAAHGSVPVYPCGLIAWSAMNDTVYGMDTVGATTRYYTDHITVGSADYQSGSECTASTCTLVKTTSSGISWSSDRDEKFQKLSTCPGNSALMTTAGNPKITMPYNSYKYYMCPSENTATCSIGHTTTGNSQGDTTICVNSLAPSAGDFAYGTSAGTTLTTCQESERCGDVTNEEFIVWMRTSGLPTFRKLHRVINTDLKKGQTIIFYVNDVFPVTAFDGTKKIVLSTTTWIGGKNTFLGAAYITVACICILLGVAFLIKELFSPKQTTEVQG